ncbi:MAG: toprim domain-containing protein [Candidatus Micrarchaeia archaeon]
MAERKKLLDKTFEALSGSVVVVEGKRDAAALAGVGVVARVVLAVGRLEGVARRVAGLAGGGRVVLLTDFDLEGERKAAELKELLSLEGVRVDDRLRRDFRRLFGVRCVEEVGTAFERLQEELAGAVNRGVKPRRV